MVDVVTPPNGNGRHGIIDRMSERLVRALPPAFLLLVILNCAFLGTTMWVVQHNADQRNAMLTKIVEGCLTQRQP